MALLIQRTFAQEHRLPLWNPYFGGGQPLAANPLAALFYPPTQLVHFLSLRNYFLVLIMGHLIFAGLGMLLLARRAMGLSRFPALLAAVSFMATPRLLAHLGAGHITLVQTVSWYPWLALACWATVQKSWHWGAALGVCIAMTLLAGHPQMAYYGMLMLAGLAIWLLVRRWQREGWRALPAPVMGLVGASIIGLLLAAVHLLPLAELTARSTRQLSVYSNDTFPLLSFLYTLVFQQPPTAPGFFWEGVTSPGLVVLILALFAVVTKWRKCWPFVFAIVLVASLAMGNSAPVYPLVARILPDLGQFRSAARIWFIALVMFPLLAGIGTEELLRAIQRVSSRRALIAGFLAVSVVACSLVISDRGYARIYDTSTPTTPSAVAYAAARMAGSGRVYSSLPQLYAVELQTPFANGSDPLLIQSYISYMDRASDYVPEGYQLYIPVSALPAQTNATLLGFMNVSVVVSSVPLTDPHFVLEERIDGQLIYKNTAAAGQTYLVKPGPDGRPPSLSQLQRINTSVHTIVQGTDQSTLISTFSTNTTAYLVVAMPAFPGWSATLDGHPVAIQQVAGVFPAIKVTPGTHTLRYTYAPSSVYIGAMLSLLGLLATLVWIIVALQRHRFHLA